MSSHLSVSNGFHLAFFSPLCTWCLLVLSPGVMEEGWERFLGIRGPWFLAESPEATLYPSGSSLLDKSLSYNSLW